jgi:hypothetical protein
VIRARGSVRLLAKRPKWSHGCLHGLLGPTGIRPAARRKPAAAVGACTVLFSTRGVGASVAKVSMQPVPVQLVSIAKAWITLAPHLVPFSAT